MPVNASSELEFFRHRIHVERDSVKRARETLRAQKNIFQGVQKAWKERSARATLEQLVQVNFFLILFVVFLLLLVFVFSS